MSAPQGLFYFSGIKGFLQGRFVLTDGVQPSLATIYIPPQDTPLPPIGDLAISYTNGGALFPESRIVHVHFDVDDDGKEIWGLTIADARWRWKFARISGEYNIRDVNGNPKAETIADSRELAKILAKAIGIKKFDVGELPAGDFPEKHWDYDRADTELEALLTHQGCRLVPLTNGAFAVKIAGQGAKLPKNGLTMNFSDAVNPPETPESIIFVPGHTQYQVDFELEAVGRELNGEIKPIDQLSYKPRGGWDAIDIPHFMNVDRQTPLRTKNRDTAQEDIFRLFRIKLPEDGIKVPFEKETVKNLNRIVLTDKQIYRAKVLRNVESIPATVYGQFHRESHQIKADYELDNIEPNLAKAPEQKWHQGVEIVNDRNGIIRLGAYCRRIVDNKNKVPVIRLRTAFNLRDEETLSLNRYEIEKRLSRQPNGTPKLYIMHDEVCLAVVDRKADGTPGEFSNLKRPIDDIPLEGFSAQFPTLEKYADYFVQGALRELRIEDSTSAKYGGLVSIPLDGAIRQIVWEVDGDGRATTTISRNTEIVGDWPSRAERLYSSKAAGIADKFQQLNLIAGRGRGVQGPFRK